MDFFKVIALWILSLASQWTICFPVTAPTYYPPESSTPSRINRYSTATTTPAPKKLSNYYPNSYYSRLPSSDYTSNRAAKYNSKFAGYDNQESRRYHRRNNNRRRSRRRRPSNPNYDPCVGRAAQPKAQGRVFWDVNVYNVHPASHHPSDYNPGYPPSDYRPSGYPSDYRPSGYPSDYRPPHNPYPPPPPPPAVYDDYDCGSSYGDDYDERPTQQWNNFLDFFRPGGIFYQDPNYNGNYNPPPSNDETGTQPISPGVGTGSGGIFGGAGGAGGVGGPGGAGGGPPAAIGPGTGDPSPSQIVGGLATYVNGVIQTIIGNRRPGRFR